MMVKLIIKILRSYLILYKKTTNSLSAITNLLTDARSNGYQPLFGAKINPFLLLFLAKSFVLVYTSPT